MEPVIAGDDEAKSNDPEELEVEEDDVIAALFEDDDTAARREIFAISIGTSSETKNRIKIL